MIYYLLFGKMPRQTAAASELDYVASVQTPDNMR